MAVFWSCLLGELVSRWGNSTHGAKSVCFHRIVRYHPILPPSHESGAEPRQILKKEVCLWCAYLNPGPQALLPEDEK